MASWKVVAEKAQERGMHLQQNIQYDIQMIDGVRSNISRASEHRAI